MLLDAIKEAKGYCAVPFISNLSIWNWYVRLMWSIAIAILGIWLQLFLPSTRTFNFRWYYWH
jgi:hypothetical protein